MIDAASFTSSRCSARLSSKAAPLGLHRCLARWCLRRHAQTQLEGDFGQARVRLAHRAQQVLAFVFGHGRGARVWSRRDNANPKVVRAYVKRLRHQLGDDAACPTWIVNERGVGYRMARPGEA